MHPFKIPAEVVRSPGMLHRETMMAFGGGGFTFGDFKSLREDDRDFEDRYLILCDSTDKYCPKSLLQSDFKISENQCGD